MESHEVMKKAVTNIGAKSVASDMNLSASLIYKWCESTEGEDAGGADNPLDRVHKIYELTGDTGPISWLCNKADGFYVNNPDYEEQADNVAPILPMTRRILREFSALLDAVSESLEDDGKIDQKESKLIRAKWEDLKSISEGFVVACEQGQYNVKNKK